MTSSWLPRKYIIYQQWSSVCLVHVRMSWVYSRHLEFTQDIETDIEQQTSCKKLHTLCTHGVLRKHHRHICTAVSGDDAWLHVKQAASHSKVGTQICSHTRKTKLIITINSMQPICCMNATPRSPTALDGCGLNTKLIWAGSLINHSIAVNASRWLCTASIRLTDSNVDHEWNQLTTRQVRCSHVQCLQFFICDLSDARESCCMTAIQDANSAHIYSAINNLGRWVPIVVESPSAELSSLADTFL